MAKFSGEPAKQKSLGSIRQDVNISIEGGARVELKGVQDIELMEECAIQEIKAGKSHIDQGRIKKKEYF